jgi:dihydrofolate reductase/thymidylate synthase
MYKLNFILCTDIKGGISKNGLIPWNIPQDMKYFRDVITQKFNNKPNLIICGKNTFQQMGIIKNHNMLIISKTIDINQNTNDIIIRNSIQETLDYIKSNYNKYSNIFICGGSSIYNNFFNICINQHNEYETIIYANVINKDYQCDNLISNKFYDVIINQKNNIHNRMNIDHLIEMCVKDNSTQESVKITFLKPFTSKNHIVRHNNYDESKYLELMYNLLKAPIKVGRNGATQSLFGNMLKFDIRKHFPLLTTKRVYFKGVFEELMFFIRGDTNAKHLSEKDVRIWEGNTTKEFIHNCGLNYEEGDMGPMYGFQWLHFNAQYHGMHGDYTDKGFNQIEYVLNELKTNPTSRRIIMTTYNPAQAKQGVLFPCHGIGIVFNAEKDILDVNDQTYYLNCMQLQRSCDYFLGVPFNIASYSLLVYMICEVLNNDNECKYIFKPGELTMSLGDYHLYNSHIEEASRQVVRTPNEFPSLHFNKKIYNLEDFKLEDIEIINYNPGVEIKAKMVS